MWWIVRWYEKSLYDMRYDKLAFPTSLPTKSLPMMSGLVTSGPRPLHIITVLWLTDFVCICPVSCNLTYTTEQKLCCVNNNKVFPDNTCNAQWATRKHRKLGPIHNFPVLHEPCSNSSVINLANNFLLSFNPYSKQCTYLLQSLFNHSILTVCLSAMFALL